MSWPSTLRLATVNTLLLRSFCDTVSAVTNHTSIETWTKIISYWNSGLVSNVAHLWWPFYRWTFVSWLPLGLSFKLVHNLHSFGISQKFSSCLCSVPEISHLSSSTISNFTQCLTQSALSPHYTSTNQSNLHREADCFKSQHFSK